MKEISKACHKLQRMHFVYNANSSREHCLEWFMSGSNLSLGTEQRARISRRNSRVIVPARTLTCSYR
ncbi:hypothetical protein PUN28_001192 [Cardiocondyla obscurior]|uniref:Uncharacterized protein n=1 Tax=Cardiocondyla obscurior TaxID=286306 RepID=A0AAW2H3N0_9HYME